MNGAVGEHHGPDVVAFQMGLTRRRVLLNGALFGGLALGGGSVLEACSSAKTSAGSSAGATPRPGGSVVGGLANVVDVMDPTTAYDDSSVVLSDYVFESLYRLDPYDRSQVMPQLAVGLPEQITDTKYRVKIRGGVKFHDGTPLTADDVVFTINRILDPKVNSLYVAFFSFMDSKSAKAISPTEIELNLKTPCTLLEKRLVLIHVMSQAAVTGPNSHKTLTVAPIGSGPYRVTKFVSDQSITLQKFDGYTGNLNATYDQITLNVLTNDNARLAALETSQVSAIENVPNADFAGLANSATLHTASVQSFGQVDLLFHCGKPPFNTPAARQAVCFALNRDLITKDVFFGQATAAWDNALLPSNEGYVVPKLVFSYDPQKAKQLLAQAGVKPGTAIDVLIASDYSYIENQAPIIKQNLSAIGLVPNIILGMSNALYGRVAKGTFNAFFSPGDTSLLGVYDTEALLRWDYYGVAARELYYWHDANAVKVSVLLDKAIAAPTVAQRNQYLAEVQNLVQSEAPAPTIHFVKQLTAWSDKLSGFRPTPSVALDFIGVTGSA